MQKLQEKIYYYMNPGKAAIREALVKLGVEDRIEFDENEGFKTARESIYIYWAL